MISREKGKGRALVIDTGTESAERDVSLMASPDSGGQERERTDIMKRFSFVLLAAAMAFMPATAQAGPVTVGDSITMAQVTGVTGGGGPFVLTGPDYDFITFCLELSEALGFPMQVGGISTYAEFNGVGGTDALDARAAYLYNEYRLGNIGTTLADAEALQLALWWIEGEFNGDVLTPGAAVYGGPVNATASAYVAAAGVAVAGGWGSTIGPVRVINLLKQNVAGGWEPAQDVLMLLPVPDGGTTLMLLGGALVGIGALRRRIRG